MGEYANRAWPHWLTIPGYQDLADARHWHFMFAWMLAINGRRCISSGVSRRAMSSGISGRHWPTSDRIPRSILDHMLLKHPMGEAAKRYNVLQRFAYLGVIVLISLWS